MQENTFLLDYYVTFNKKSEFIYVVVKQIKAFALTKKFLSEQLFPKYPMREFLIKRASKQRYKRHVK